MNHARSPPTHARTLLRLGSTRRCALRLMEDRERKKFGQIRPARPVAGEGRTPSLPTSWTLHNPIRLEIVQQAYSEERSWGRRVRKER